MQWIERPLRVDDTVKVARGAYSTDVSLADLVSAPPRFRRITDTDYTLQLEDSGVFLIFTSDDPIALTVPVEFVGATRILQAGAGAITVAGGDGATVENLSAQTDSAGQWALLTLCSVPALDATFLLTGDTA